jgi:hypothetical protein
MCTRTKLISVLVFLLLVPVGALADSACPLEVTSKLNSLFGYEYPPEATSDRTFYVCKALPNNPDKIVVAMVINGDHVLTFENLMPKAKEKEYEDGGFKGHLNVLIVSVDGKKLYGQLLRKDIIYSNAIILDGISIDTARYYLEEGSTVFGVRVGNTANSHVYMASYATLSLFKFRNNSITEILDRLQTYSYSGNIENCDLGVASIFEESKSTLSVAKTVTHGMNDIIVHTVAKRINASCADEKDTVIPVGDTFTTLRFNGSVYPIKKK